MSAPMSRNVLPLLLVAAMGVRTSHADEVTDKAEAGLEELRFEDALAIATQGLEEGVRGPEELARLYMILGRVAASMGEEEEAERYFQNALSIDQSVGLADGVSPKLSEPFATAKSIIGEADPIALIFELGKDGKLSVQITSDPAKLVKGARATFEANGKTDDVKSMGTGTLYLELPEGAENIEVTLIDEFGNHLVAPAPLMKSKTVKLDKKIDGNEPSLGASPPLYRRWQLYAGLAVGSLAAGAYFGNDSRSKTDEIAGLDDGTEFSVALALEDEARSSALLANIGFAAALGFGAVSVWMYMDEDSKKESEPRTTISPLLGAGRTGLAASVRF